MNIYLTSNTAWFNKNWFGFDKWLTHHTIVIIRFFFAHPCRQQRLLDAPARRPCSRHLLATGSWDMSMAVTLGFLLLARMILASYLAVEHLFLPQIPFLRATVGWSSLFEKLYNSTRGLPLSFLSVQRQCLDYLSLVLCYVHRSKLMTFLFTAIYQAWIESLIDKNSNIQI